jgi:hypothetical protein
MRIACLSGVSPTSPIPPPSPAHRTPGTAADARARAPDRWAEIEAAGARTDGSARHGRTRRTRSGRNHLAPNPRCVPGRAGPSCTRSLFVLECRGLYFHVKVPVIPDPKWLEILKAGGGTTLALALACGIFLFSAHWGWLPALDPWMTQAAAFGLLVFGFLTIAACGSALYKHFPVLEWVAHHINDGCTKQEVRDYIPYMNPHERRIIGYLIANNQKQFTGEADGGHAATLIACGIVISTLQSNPNQIISEINVPMRIPDLIWDVLIAHKDQFPNPGVQVPPWLRHP